MGLRTSLPWTVRLALWWSGVWQGLRTPLTWYEGRIEAQRRHEERLAAIQAAAQAEALASLGRTLSTVLEKTLEAQGQQTKLLQTWLDGFRLAAAPVGSTVMTDRDEVAAERLRYAQEVAEAQHALEVPWGPQQTVDWLGDTERARELFSEPLTLKR